MAVRTYDESDPRNLGPILWPILVADVGIGGPCAIADIMAIGKPAAWILGGVVGFALFLFSFCFAKVAPIPKRDAAAVLGALPAFVALIFAAGALPPPTKYFCVGLIVVIVGWMIRWSPRR